MFLKLAEVNVGGYDAIMAPAPYQIEIFDDVYGRYGVAYYFNYT